MAATYGPTSIDSRSSVDPSISQGSIVLRTQLPFLLVLFSVLLVGQLAGVGPAWSYAAAALISCASCLVTAVCWPRGGQTALMVSAILHVLAVAVVNYALWELAPSMSGLMMLPALHLSYGFRGRVLPYVLAITLPPTLTLLALALGGAPTSSLLGALLQNFALIGVSTVVYLHTRRTWRRRVELQGTLAQARTAVRTAQIVADAIETGVTYYDSDGKVHIRNQAMTQMAHHAGYDLATGRAQHMYHSDHHTPLKAGEQPAERMLRGEAVDHSLLYLGPPGNQRAVEFTAIKLPKEEGPQGWVLTAHDVTDLSNAVTTREEMILTFTHELRTPLTSIIGFAEFLQDTADLDALGLVGPVDAIYRNATHLSTLVQTLIQAGTEAHAQIRPVPGDVSAVTRETVASLEPKAKGRDVTLSLAVRASDTTAVFDGLRLRQALENLVSNALRHSATGGRTHVILGATDLGITVEVTDDGPGIDPQDMPQLFQRGFRSYNARRTATQGMGLGLAIARDIARAHGGDITARNNTGAGATFTLHLPRQQPHP